MRAVIRKRLLDEPRIKAGEAALERMLLTLAKGGFVTLEPEPPVPQEGQPNAPYAAELATPTPALDRLLVFRSVHPLYGAYLTDRLGIADANERIQALESVLELPRPLLRRVRVPADLPPGPLATTRLDAELVRRGLVAAHLLVTGPDDEEEYDEGGYDQDEERPPALAEKLRLLFDALYPEVGDVITQPVWAAGELIRFEGNFNKYVQAHDLIKQEGIIFRHLLRLILLCEEFAQLCPPETTADEWRGFLRDLGDRLTASCRAVDPTSTDELMQYAHAADVVEGEAVAQPG